MTPIPQIRAHAQSRTGTPRSRRCVLLITRSAPSPRPRAKTACDTPTIRSASLAVRLVWDSYVLYVFNVDFGKPNNERKQIITSFKTRKIPGIFRGVVRHIYNLYGFEDIR